MVYFTNITFHIILIFILFVDEVLLFKFNKCIDYILHIFHTHAFLYCITRNLNKHILELSKIHENSYVFHL